MCALRQFSATSALLDLADEFQNSSGGASDLAKLHATFDILLARNNRLITKRRELSRQIAGAMQEEFDELTDRLSELCYRLATLPSTSARTLRLKAAALRCVIDENDDPANCLARSICDDLLERGHLLVLPAA